MKIIPYCQSSNGALVERRTLVILNPECHDSTRISLLRVVSPKAAWPPYLNCVLIPQNVPCLTPVHVDVCQ